MLVNNVIKYSDSNSRSNRRIQYQYPASPATAMLLRDLCPLSFFAVVRTLFAIKFGVVHEVLHDDACSS